MKMKLSCFALIFAGLAGCPERANLTNTATATLGTEGGEIAVAGVSVEFPPQALRAPTTITLSVKGPDLEVAISPDLELDVPATVRGDAHHWPVVEPALAQRLDALAGEWYFIDELTFKDGVWEFRTQKFSTTRPVPLSITATPAKCMESPWPLHQACGNPLFNEGERKNTVIDPGDLSSSSVGLVSLPYCCLYDMRGTAVHDPNTCNAGTRLPDEALIMTVEAASALIKARRMVASRMPGYDVWINGAWDSSRSCHGANSKHSFGAALDLVPCRYEGGSTTDCSKDRSRLGELAPILYEAGFTWVFYEDNHPATSDRAAGGHIHASITSSLGACVDPSGGEGPAGCMAPDGL